MALIEKLTAIGDAIREKTNGTELLTLDKMPSAIKGIETGGGGFPNGTVWTKADYIYNAVKNVTYADGIFVADGGTNALQYSIDGKTWIKTTTISSINDASIYPISISYARGIWVAVRKGCGRTLHSQNGIDWVINESTLPANNSEAEVVNVNGLWIYYNGSGVYYSVDGKIWEASNLTSGTYKYLTQANGVYILAKNYDGIYRSTDCVTWTRTYTYSSGMMYSTVYAKGYFYASGEMGIVRSSDGLTWEKISSNKILGMCYNDGLFVGNTSTGLIYSNDFVTWEQSNISKYWDYKHMHKHNGIWIYGSYTSNSPIYYSVDGKAWVESNITSTRLYSAVNANGIWVIATLDGIYYSTTWEPTKTN